MQLRNDPISGPIPVVVVPSRDFLVGALFGFIAARNRLEENVQPLVSDQESNTLREVKNEDFSLGSWFEITCNKCDMFYVFNEPNELPLETMKCTNKDCDNVLIVYGISDPRHWRIGQMKFV